MAEIKAKRSTSMNRGADDERAAILAGLRRMKKVFNAVGHKGICTALGELESWIMARSKRTAKKIGGLGRK